MSTYDALLVILLVYRYYFEQAHPTLSPLVADGFNDDGPGVDQAPAPSQVCSHSDSVQVNVFRLFIMYFEFYPTRQALAHMPTDATINAPASNTARSSPAPQARAYCNHVNV